MLGAGSHRAGIEKALVSGPLSTLSSTVEKGQKLLSLPWVTDSRREAGNTTAPVASRECHELYASR